MTARAVPVHTIVRYRPRPLGFYQGWRPVEAMRFRLFVNATHEEVTGDARGADWTHDWSCESLTTSGWHISGRNTWRTLEEARACVDVDTYETFEEARAAAMKIADQRVRDLVDETRRARWNVDEILRAVAPDIA